MNDGNSLEVTIPVRTVSEANRASHEHWRVRQQRAKAQRSAANLVMISLSNRLRGCIALPVTVTITRVAPRALDDDNLSGSQKHVRDGIADALGIDDRDPRVSWRYAQRRGAPKQYCVLVSIEPRTVA